MSVSKKRLDELIDLYANIASVRSFDTAAALRELKSTRQAAAECRAVLGKVEEMLRANKDGWITAYVNADGKSFLVDFSTCCDDEEEDTASTKEGKTLLDALAALVDGTAVEAKGGE